MKRKSSLTNMCLGADKTHTTHVYGILWNSSLLYIWVVHEVFMYATIPELTPVVSMNVGRETPPGRGDLRVTRPVLECLDGPIDGSLPIKTRLDGFKSYIHARSSWDKREIRHEGLEYA